MQLLMLNDAVIGWTNEEVPIGSGYKTHPVHEVNVRPIILAHKNVITGTEMVTRTYTHKIHERWRYEVSSVIGFGSTEQEALANRAIGEAELLKMSQQVVAALSTRYVAYANSHVGVYKVDRINGTVPLAEPGEVQGYGLSAGEAVRDAERQLEIR